MTANRLMVVRRYAVVAGLTGVIGLSGCGQHDEIAHYRVAKSQTVPSRTTTFAGDAETDRPGDISSDRMLAAIVPTESKVWFFKLTGPADQVDSEVDAFRQLVSSITFTSADANPQWQLPSGWSAAPATGMRFATLQTEAGDVSVIALPVPQDVEANIERWRGQLRLPPMDDESPPERIAVGRYEAVLVDLVGKADSSKMMAPSAQPAAPPGESATAGPQPTPGSAAPVDPGFTYESPTGWRTGRADGMRRAAFTMGDDDQAAEVTVITLPGQAGGVLSNVNRWRGQIGLSPVDQPTLDDSLVQVDVSGMEAQSVELIGPVDADNRQSILAVMLLKNNVSWFFKLMGPATVVEDQKSNFEMFIQSVSFP